VSDVVETRRVASDACVRLSGAPDASGRQPGRPASGPFASTRRLAETIASEAHRLAGTALEMPVRMSSDAFSVRGVHLLTVAFLSACPIACAGDQLGPHGRETGEERVDSVARGVDGAPIDRDAEEPGAIFVDVPSYLEAPEDIDAWYQLVAELRSGFDAVCGDTFCEGEYSNYQSLRFRCSVEQTTGTIGSCVWVFAASAEEIAPETGVVTVDGRLFACEMPLAPGTDIRTLLEELLAPGVDPLKEPLPGSDRSLYDGVAECL
jgi:hypothetical protein